MSHPILDDDEEKPLDPAVARIQTKLKGLLLVSALIMGLGFAAVLSAIIYRVVKNDGAADFGGKRFIEAEVPDALTGDVVSTALDGQRMAITVRTDKGLRVFLVDLASGEMQHRIDLVGKP